LRILLLQEAIYLPSLGGGNKACRFLLEGLAQLGHDCAAVCPALTTRAGPTTEPEFLAEMAARRITVSFPEPHLFFYRYHGVQISAMNFAAIDQSRDTVIRRIREFQPDWVLVSDDKRGWLLDSALLAAPNGVVLLAHTNMHLPFGPMTNQASQERTELMKKARGIIVPSRYMKEYIQRHSGLETTPIPFPAYGRGPFPNLARHNAGFVTMINPCPVKGLAIFIALAGKFPQVEFAAVPTWGADEAVLRALKELPNVQLLKAVDDIGEIMARTRVLLVPSLIPETFGFVAVEAMLRGIPVLASDLGGLREAKLGVDYLLPVSPIVQGGAEESPQQEIGPWASALSSLLSDSEIYQHCSQVSHAAALKFVSSVGASAFEQFLNKLAPGN